MVVFFGFPVFAGVVVISSVGILVVGPIVVVAENEKEYKNLNTKQEIQTN